MSYPARVLIVDDDTGVLTAARWALDDEAFEAELLSDPQQLAKLLLETRFDALLLDMNFGFGARDGGQGLQLLEEIARYDGGVATVLMTSYGSVALAVAGIKQGAFDFVLKPWKNEKLVAAVAAAVAETRRRRALNPLADSAGQVDLELLERRAIERALAAHDRNVALAASALGLTRQALYRRMVKHGI